MVIGDALPCTQWRQDKVHEVEQLVHILQALYDLEMPKSLEQSQVELLPFQLEVTTQPMQMATFEYLARVNGSIVLNLLT